VVAVPGDRQPDLVQLRSPGQQVPIVGSEAQVRRPLVEQGQGAVCHPARLLRVDRETACETQDAARAHVLVLEAAQQVVEQALPQGALGNPHALDAEPFEDRPEDRDPSRDHGPSVGLQALEFQGLHAAPFDQGRLEPREPRGRHLAVAPTLLAQDLGRGPNRARGADDALPTPVEKTSHHGLELQTRRGPRAGHSLGGDLAPLEVGEAPTHAAHGEAAFVLRLEALTEHALGTSASDVDHQPAARVVPEGVRDPQVDQACLFTAGQDLDRKAEGLLGAGAKTPAAQAAEGRGAHGPHPLGPLTREALAEALEARERPLGHRFVERAPPVQALGQAHPLTQPIDDAHRAVLLPGNHQVKAVRPQVDRRQGPVLIRARHSRPPYPAGGGASTIRSGPVAVQVRRSRLRTPPPRRRRPPPRPGSSSGRRP
jgi:hypothetical protein